ncbi:two-component system, NarL family, sensor histidine kinase LiaS [Amphibacillus marinus]|uniref:histidine kinase n=1 Tax=Amphibacillus marinus TaxID=872970 RepID=A0A1H8RVC4_9BACI|nr:sensor histidine kinase [Amphibacillus marinus]SEO70098.1 two-component system, NarL family, sensor histidine kinase LiaS [Amphibacillus marinus]
MLNKLNSIRYTFIQAQLTTILFTTILMLVILSVISMIYNPDWLGQLNIVLFSMGYFFLGSIIAVLVGFRTSGQLKSKIDDLSVMIMHLSRGNYRSRLQHEPEGEVARIAVELNELAKKLDDQVRYLQRLADEKAAYAETAHKIATIEERQRLARDLHDSVSQQLFALTMMSQALVRIIEKNPAKARQQMAEVAETAMKAQAEMRALLLHLRPIHLSDQSLSDGIANLIAELKTKCDIQFELKIDQVSSLAKYTEEHLFRIIQEGLSNILRHADAEHVKLFLIQKKDHVFIRLADDGKGFDWTKADQKKTSYGLKTMQERGEEIGGQFQLRTKIGEGTYIELRVPSHCQEDK